MPKYVLYVKENGRGAEMLSVHVKMLVAEKRQVCLCVHVSWWPCGWGCVIIVVCVYVLLGVWVSLSACNLMTVCYCLWAWVGVWLIRRTRRCVCLTHVLSVCVWGGLREGERGIRRGMEVWTMGHSVTDWTHLLLSTHTHTGTDSNTCGHKQSCNESPL